MNNLVVKDLIRGSYESTKPQFEDEHHDIAQFATIANFSDVLKVNMSPASNKHGNSTTVIIEPDLLYTLPSNEMNKCEFSIRDTRSAPSRVGPITTISHAQHTGRSFANTTKITPVDTSDDILLRQPECDEDTLKTIKSARRRLTCAKYTNYCVLVMMFAILLVSSIMSSTNTMERIRAQSTLLIAICFLLLVTAGIRSKLHDLNEISNYCIKK